MAQNINSDKIKFFKNKVIHESAGGFVFFESFSTHKLYVALLQKLDGKYYIPKGHILKGEKPEKAAIREVKEELGVKENPEIIAKISTDSYRFSLKSDNRLHYKKVHLYVFRLKQKVILKPLKKENFVKADWFEFDEALEKITFDKENLLKAKKLFYLK